MDTIITRFYVHILVISLQYAVARSMFTIITLAIAGSIPYTAFGACPGAVVSTRIHEIYIRKIFEGCTSACPCSKIFTFIPYQW